MTEGRVVRFEEITRCPLEVQDCLLSPLSDRVLAVPELTGEDALVFAREGFNVIATANTRDRGVNEMSAALKRRFNFETVFAITDFATELALVEQEATHLLQGSGVAVAAAPRRAGGAGHRVPRAARGQDRARRRDGAAVVGDEHRRGGVGGARRGSARLVPARGRRGRRRTSWSAWPGPRPRTTADDLAKLRTYLEQHAQRRKGEPVAGALRRAAPAARLMTSPET